MIPTYTDSSHPYEMPLVDYEGISHPFWCISSGLFYRVWKRLMCRRDFHLFDEVLSDTDRHYLVCDACCLEVGISYIGAYCVSVGAEDRRK